MWFYCTIMMMDSNWQSCKRSSPPLFLSIFNSATTDMEMLIEEHFNLSSAVSRQITI